MLPVLGAVEHKRLLCEVLFCKQDTRVQTVCQDS